MFFLPESTAYVGGEETVDDRVGRGVERRQALYERRHGEVGLGGFDVAEHLQKVEHYVRAPAHYEH